jgi:hypothetical protein
VSVFPDQPSSNKPPQLSYAASTPRRRGWWIGLLILGFLFGGWGLLRAIDHLTPSLGRSTETANQVKCLMNLRSLGLMLQKYANENSGKFPDSLATLIVKSQNDPKEIMQCLICPSSNDEVIDIVTREDLVQGLLRGSPDRFAAQKDRPGFHLSYIYCAQGLGTDARPGTVLAYEPISNHFGGGIAVLFADGSPDFIAEQTALKFIVELQAGHNPPRPEMLGN